jgi:hypothetical protein
LDWHKWTNTCSICQKPFKDVVHGVLKAYV